VVDHGIDPSRLLRGHVVQAAAMVERELLREKREGDKESTCAAPRLSSSSGARQIKRSSPSVERPKVAATPARKITMAVSPDVPAV
jgi:hypothetical protein